MSIHPTAVVSKNAELAQDVEVGPFVVIEGAVVLRSGVSVGSHAVLKGPMVVGEGTRVFHHAVIGEDPQDLKYKGEATRLEIGQRNTFREFSTAHRGTAAGKGGGVTRIGDDNLFMAYSHVAHDCIVGSQCIMSNCTALAGHVQLGDWVILSGYSAIHQFCKIGSHAFLANNAAVTRDVPPYLLVAGSPAEPKGVNSEGLKRRGFNPGQIANIKGAYRLFYRSGLKLAEATAELKALVPTQTEIAPFVDFLAASERSIIR